MAFTRQCSQCDCAVLVLHGRPDDRVCVHHPDHEGQLVLIASGDRGPDDIVARCRNFRLRRERAVGPSVVMPEESVRYIDLTGGFFAIVDAGDYEWLSKHTWRVTGGYSSYACCKIANKTVYMHRLIMNPPPGMVVDHINRNRWDNRRSNLRACTQAENLQNRRKSRGTSVFKGVFWHTRRRKWLATIGHMGKTIQIGFFDEEIKAARAYDDAARRLFGQYACLNFPDPAHIVYLSGCIHVHSHISGRLAAITVRHRQALACRCHPQPTAPANGFCRYMPAPSAGMAPFTPTRPLSSRPEAEGRSGEIWLRMEGMSFSWPDASTTLRSARHDTHNNAGPARSVRRVFAVSRGPPQE
jgi:hypothetical protein